MKRGSWFGILCRVAACLPFVLCTAALLVSQHKPLAGAYLSASRTYAHFLVDGRLIVLRGDYAGWMIERRWRNDLETALRDALRNQQDTFNYWDIGELQDRVRQSTPEPELTESLAQEAVLYVLGPSRKTTHWGVLTRRTFWPPRTGTSVRMDAIGIRQLLQLSTIPVFVVAVLYCVGARRQARRRRRNACSSCGYSLVGNASGVCPECGTPGPERQPASDSLLARDAKRATRSTRLGAIVQVLMCLPFVVFAAALGLETVRPGAATHLSSDRMYAHFLIDDRFVVIQGDYSDWMVRERWWSDVEQTYSTARSNQRETITRRGLRSLRDRVERSVPRPELTNQLARESVVRLLTLWSAESFAGVLTRGPHWPPSTRGRLKLDVTAVALVPLVGLSAIPVIVLAAAGCLRVYHRRRSRRRGVCACCGHGLADCDGGVCPACGTSAGPSHPTKTGTQS